MAGVLQLEIANTPFAVIDFETTGLSAHSDRVIEVSVVRVEPGRRPQLVLDTLINPLRPVYATEIHGITDAHVRQAPTFKQAIDLIQTAVSDCVVAAYNAYFDIRFWNNEMQRAGRNAAVPFVCLMYLRPLIGLGDRCCLTEACRAHRIPFNSTHRAATDALAAAALFPHLISRMNERGISTFDDLRKGRHHKYLKSFVHSPLLSPARPSTSHILPRELSRTPKPEICTPPRPRLSHVSAANFPKRTGLLARLSKLLSPGA